MKKVKIFITEDEFIVSKNLENKLIGLGYEVLGTSPSGEETLEKIKLEQPDLILMDIMLAGKMDGIDTAKIIKDEFNIPLIFLTAYSSEEIYRRAEITEPYAYIIKPFEERELEINISIALYKQKIEEKLKSKQKSLELLNQNLDRMVQERTMELVEKNNSLQNEISERINAQEKEQRFINVIKQAEDHILITDAHGIIEYANPKMLNFIGYSSKEIYGKTPRVLKSGSQPITFYKDLWSTILKGENFKGEFINKKKNGDLYFAQEIIVPLRNSENNITHFASIGRDITEKRNFEKSMTNRIEKEKERISNELHDGIGQSITATKFSLMALLRNINISKKDEKTIKNIITQTDDLTNELRMISFNLIPSVLKDFGLEAAVSKSIENVAVSDNLKILFDYKCGDDRYHEEMELGVYRIIQEALNNSLKYSKANLINIEIGVIEGNELSLSVTDNGVGFDYENYKKGQGISNMKQRTSILNGSFDVKTNKKRGTQISVAFPIQN